MMLAFKILFKTKQNKTKPNLNNLKVMTFLFNFYI